MEEEVFENYLEERYECQVNWYSKRASWNKRYYQWFQWVAIIISASIPVLVASMPAREMAYYFTGHCSSNRHRGIKDL